MPAAPAAMCRVLIVEDDPDAREVMAILAGRRGGEVRVAGSVGEAIAALRAALPTHILLDLMLPDYGGVELLRVVRENNFPVRVALVTASGPGSRAVAETLAWQPDAVFHKPVKFAEIEAWLASE